MDDDIQVEISSAADIVTARQRGRALAIELGFNGADLTMIATAISEIARNIVDHAKQGSISMAGIHRRKAGILIVARDVGPGIRDVPMAMLYGYSTEKRSGVGLPEAKWLMDEFDVNTKEGRGTVVTMKKWLQ